MPSNVTVYDYPFDPTGQYVSNKITGEINTLMAVNFRDYHFFVPRFAPFFADSLTLSFRDTTGAIKPLVEGIDYLLSHEFIGASRACAKPVYGSISFLNVALNGTLTLGYQTIGGQWTLSLEQIATILADRLENPRTTTWEQVVSMPVVFPVIDHPWDLVDMVGMSAVVTELDNIAVNLRQQGTGGLADHLADHNNPHVVTKLQVGLGSVRNLATSDQPTAVAGVSDDVYMTPLSTMWSMTANIINPFNAHAAAHNPHGTSAADVGAYTQAQVDTLLATKLNTGSVAYDSQRLGGMVYNQVRDAILLGTAANSILFNGYNFNDYMAYVLAGTAANSMKFNGFDYATFITQLDARYTSASSSAQQKLFQFYDTTGTAPRIWMQLATVRMPDPGTSYVPLGDVQWLVSGMQDAARHVSCAYYVRASTRGPAGNVPSLTVVALDGITTDAQFGYTISGDNLTMTIWVNTDPGRQSLTVTELSKGMGGTFGAGTAVVVTEPAGIAYAPPVFNLTSAAGDARYATQQQLTDLITAITNNFIAMAS